MSFNVEILPPNTNLNNSCSLENQKAYQAVSIVTEILEDIFATSVPKSEIEAISTAIGDQNNDFMKNPLDGTTSNNNDLVALTKNYKKEFKTILQNLKLNSLKNQPSSTNPSLDEQISKALEEIKNLEASIKLNTLDSSDSLTEFKSIGQKTAVTNFRCFSNEIEDRLCFVDDDSEEVVLQVIDLEHASSETSEKISISSRDTSESNMEEINLNGSAKLIYMEKGDQERPKSAKSVHFLPEVQVDAGENHVPIPGTKEENGMETNVTKDERKKRNFGRRLWRFFTKNSRHNHDNNQTSKNADVNNCSK